MAVEKYANAFWTHLTAPMLVGDSAAHVALAAPAALQGGQFRVAIGTELLLVTAGAATTTWTVTRGIEGTTAAPHRNGLTVAHLTTVASMLGFDPRAYGGSIQSAINAAIAAGGGVVTLDGAYTITSALTIPAGSVTLRGSGRSTTTITQTTGGADVIVCGINDYTTSFIQIRDLSLSGGRYSLRLNNCLAGVFERLDLGSPTQSTVGLYTEGQCESLTFREVATTGTQSGILTGQTNGGTSVGWNTNWPILQKCVFDTVRVYGVTGGTATVITAGVIDGVQQNSGLNFFRRLLHESNGKNGVDLSNTFATTIDGFSDESTPDTDNTYSVIKLSAGNSAVTLRNCGMSGGFGGHTFKYGIEDVVGLVTIESCSTGGTGPAATADIYIGHAATIVDSIVTDAAHLVFGGAGQGKTLVMNMRDTAGTPIRTIANAITTHAWGGGIQLGGFLMASMFAFPGVHESMGIMSGAGAPEGAVAADVGSLYLRTGGGAGTTLYVKESGTGPTGWVAK